jgi:hypothetical protein
MAKKSDPRKKKTPVKKKAVKKKPAKKKSLLRRPSSSLSLTGGSENAAMGNPCQCEEGDDGFFYCYKRVQGRWVACRGPFDTRQQCIDVTNERCI